MSIWATCWMRLAYQTDYQPESLTASVGLSQANVWNDCLRLCADDGDGVEADVMLDRRQAAELRDALTGWLEDPDRFARNPDVPKHVMEVAQAAHLEAYRQRRGES